MGRYVALLRAVNVGRTGRLAMADLRAVLEDCGFRDVRTLLQSGNVVFDVSDQPPGEIESRIERLLGERLGVQADTFVRTGEEWATILTANPMSDEATRDPAHLLVVFSRPRAAPDALPDLRAAIRGRETAEVADGHAYLFYPDGIGESKLTIGVIEGRLRVRGTARNWNTILKLADMLRQ